jgi:opacity protein-like surface antigen
MAQGAHARASAFEVFGFGPEAIAEVSARAARAQDGTATFYNPGGLAFGTGYGFRLGATGGISGLTVQGERQKLSDPVGTQLAVDADVPLQGPLQGKLRLGVGLYMLPDKAMRLRAHETTTPFFPYYDNRTQRMTVIPALSLRPIEQVGLGVGVNVLAGVAGPVDVREGQSRGLESRVEAEAKTVAAVVAGVRVEVTRKLRAGLTWRQRFGVPLRLTTTSNIAGVPLLVNVSAAEMLFDPSTVVLGASYDLSDAVTVELDGSYHRWSTWAGPLLRLDTTVSALTLASRPPAGMFKDTFGVRGAAAFRVANGAKRELKLHVGGGYESSMLRSEVQQSRSNFVDGDKVLAGLGATMLFRGLVGQGLRAGLGLQLQRVGGYSQDKLACTKVPCPADSVVGPETSAPDQGITNPGYPTLSASGMMYVISAGLGVDL